MHEVSATGGDGQRRGGPSGLAGRGFRACNVSGGLHHAMPDRTSGFCVYNDIAMAIRWLLDNGCERVAYVDVDVHHGDGVQAIFYDDPRVLTVSLHETPACLFPGTGFPAETGGPNARGSAVNVALPPGTDRRRLAARVPRRGARRCCARSGPPCSSPSTAATPIGTIRWRISTCPSTDSGPPTWRWPSWPTNSASGRWVSTGGGGYAVLNVVPRAWTHLLGIVSGEPVAPETVVPDAWRAEVGETMPLTMSDGANVAFQPFEDGISPESRIDQAIIATRNAVFPELGLDPGL